MPRPLGSNDFVQHRQSSSLTLSHTEFAAVCPAQYHSTQDICRYVELETRFHTQ